MRHVLANKRLGHVGVGVLLALGLCAGCGGRTPAPPVDVVSDLDVAPVDLPRPDLMDSSPVDVPLADVEVPPSCFGQWADLSALADAQYPGGSRECGEFAQRSESLGACVTQMVEVPEGPFLRGCLRPNEPGCSGIPLHEVLMPRFWIDRTEVTAGQYAECAESGPCDELQCQGWVTGEIHPLDSLDSQPAGCSTWSQADQYCRWAGKRLCTDAEWDKAFHGTDGRLFPWGDYPPSCFDLVPIIELTNEAYCPVPYVGPCPPDVGTGWIDVSPYSVFDLGGSVAEWVNDWAGQEYWTAHGFPERSWPVYDPQGPRGGEKHVLRGDVLGLAMECRVDNVDCCSGWCVAPDLPYLPPPPLYSGPRVNYDELVLEICTRRIGFRCCSRDWGGP